MYDFSWKDPISWIAIGVPIVIFASVIVGIWELLKLIWS